MWWSSSQIGAYFGSRLPETLLGLRAMIHPRSAFLRATAGGYILTPDGDDATVVTEVFDCGPEENRQHLLREGGGWINGTNSVLESMAASLERLEKISTV